MHAIRYLVLCLLGWVNLGRGAEPAYPEQRFFLKASINGVPVRLAWDTGSEQPALSRRAAERLRLRFTYPAVVATNGTSISCPYTEECALGVFGTNLPVRFNVLDRADLEGDGSEGVLPWGLLSNQITVWEGTNVQVVASLPLEVAAWASFPLARELPILAFELGGNPPARVLVDTGNSGGVALNPERWAQWVRAHPGQAMTKDAGSLLGGDYVEDIQWAEHFALGGLIWHGVSVQTIGLPYLWEQFTAALGVYALGRMHVVVDGRQGRIYFKAREEAPAEMHHNLLGAVFRPAPGGDTNALWAKVAPGGPAYEAGLREGDGLLAVNGLAPRQGGMDLVRREMYGEGLDAGRRGPYTFALARGTNRLEVQVTLRKILGPPPGDARRVNLAIMQNRARLNDAQAQYHLGVVLLQGGYGLPADPPAAIPWFTRSAEAQYPQGQYALGTCYLNGTGVPPDYAKAVQWFRESAAQNYAEAQNALGLCYKSGRGVPVDQAEAVRWHQQAAAQNLGAAQANLGACYVLGEGVPVDYAKGVFWLEQAARKNVAEAQENLGVCYLNGNGVARDLAEGMKWELLAARQGSPRAQARVTALRGQLTAAELQRAEARAKEFEEALARPAGSPPAGDAPNK